MNEPITPRINPCIHTGTYLYLPQYERVHSCDVYLLPQNYQDMHEQIAVLCFVANREPVQYGPPKQEHFSMCYRITELDNCFERVHDSTWIIVARAYQVALTTKEYDYIRAGSKLPGSVFQCLFRVW